MNITIPYKILKPFMSAFNPSLMDGRSINPLEITKQYMLISDGIVFFANHLPVFEQFPEDFSMSLTSKDCVKFKKALNTSKDNPVFCDDGIVIGDQRIPYFLGRTSVLNDFYQQNIAQTMAAKNKHINVTMDNVPKARIMIFYEHSIVYAGPGYRVHDDNHTGALKQVPMDNTDLFKYCHHPVVCDYTIMKKIVEMYKKLKLVPNFEFSKNNKCITCCNPYVDGVFMIRRIR